jgi:hypothetical protein
MHQKVSKIRGKTIISQDDPISGFLAILFSTILLYFLYKESFKDFDLIVFFLITFLFGISLLKKNKLVIDSNRGTLSYEDQEFAIDEINLFKITQLEKVELQKVPTFFFEQSKSYQLVLVTKDSNISEIFKQSNSLEDLTEILEILKKEGFKTIEFEEEKEIE